MTAENLIPDTEDALREFASSLTDVREGEVFMNAYEDAGRRRRASRAVG